MSIISFETKTYKSGALQLASCPNQIVIRIHKIGSRRLKQYYVPLALLDDVKQIKNHTALVAFAKANQIDNGASDAKSSDRTLSTSCPAPAPAPAKSAAKGQGIFIATKTVGVGFEAEIVDIAIADNDGNVLFESLVKPSKPITTKALHGITNKDVADAPTFDEIWQHLVAAIGDKPIVFYNADYNKRMIRQSCGKAFDSPIPKHFYTLFPNKTFCLMKFYAKHFGRWSDYRQAREWVTLKTACSQQGIAGFSEQKGAASDAVRIAKLYSKVKMTLEAAA